MLDINRIVLLSVETQVCVSGGEKLRQTGECGELHRVCESIQSVWSGDGGVGAPDRQQTERHEGRAETCTDGGGSTSAGALYHAAPYLL